MCNSSGTLGPPSLFIYINSNIFSDQNMANATSSSSLYVGDLEKEVSEAVLFDVFREIGPVLSIRVCRDANSKVSLGYAYVNFQNPLDAERAIETLNHTTIKGKMCRIMWCRRDPSLRKSGAGNIFIKNLDSEIDNKALHATFESFGTILSCKVVSDEDCKSMGYGFVHYAEEKDADKAVNEVNGMLMNGKQVYVGRFERKERKLQSLQENFTNLYVKHFDPSVSEDELRKYFEEYGEIESFNCQINKGAENSGVLYVNYKNHEDASDAIEEADGASPEGIILPGKKLVVTRHQKKQEREFIKKASQKERQQELLKFTNLYVKNLDDSVTSEILKEAFSEFGQLMSCKVMTHPDSIVSKGFGFVSFKDSGAAKQATESMNGRMLSGKPLFVTLAQKKDARKAQLETLYRGRGSVSPAFGGGGMMNPAMNQMPFMNNPMGFGFHQGPQGAFNNYPGMQRNAPGMQRPMTAQPNIMRQQRPQQAAPFSFGVSQNMRQQAPVGIGGPNRLGMGARPMGAPTGMPSAAPMDTVDPAKLATMTQEGQKNHLGEKLFAKIQATEPQHAAKITGMLLEMDNAEILNLLDSPDLLTQKVREAMSVLKRHGQ